MPRSTIKKSNTNNKYKKIVKKHYALSEESSNDDVSTSINENSDSETTTESSETESSESDSELNTKLSRKQIITIDDTGEGTNLLDICFKKINNRFCRGEYIGIDVIIDTNNSYVNCTKMCQDIAKETKSVKKFKYWKRISSAEEIIKCISISEGISQSELTFVFHGGKNIEIGGTYCHPLLVPPIAAWVSPSFGLHVSRIINEFATKMAVDKKDVTIDKLNRKIDRLMSKTDAVLDKNDEILADTKKIKTKLSVVSNARVVGTGKRSDTSVLYVIKNNPRPKKGETVYEYSVIRIAKKSLNGALSAHRLKYPRMEIIKKINFTPNSINLWTRIRNELKAKRKIDGAGCKFNLKGNFTQAKMIQYVEKIHDERFDTDDI